ncbi:hypothetical protein B7486_59960, partial [cyanobacterium TDX16]
MSESSGAPTSADEPTTGSDSGGRESTTAANPDRERGGEGDRSTNSSSGANRSGSRTRGSRGGRGRGSGSGAAGRDERSGDRNPELPDRAAENRASAEAGDRATVRKAEAAAPTTTDGAGENEAKPRIGDVRPAPKVDAGETGGEAREGGGGQRKRRRRGGRGRGGGGGGGNRPEGRDGGSRQGPGKGRGQGGGRADQPVQAILDDGPVELDEEELKGRRGRERKGKAVGRYLMVVSKRPEATQIAVLEGRMLTEHFVS